MSGSGRGRRAFRWAAALLMAAVLGGCASDGARPEPSPSRTPQGTVQNLAEGEPARITATVDRVLGPGAFLLRDADLQHRRLLVIAAVPDGLTAGALVTVAGTATLFRFADHDPALLGDRRWYADHEQRMALLGAEVVPR